MADADPPDSILRLRPDGVAWREFGDEVVLLDLRSSKYIEANEAATLLWKRLEQGATRAQLTDALVQTYEIAPDLAATDVDAFLAECRSRDLLDGEARPG